MARARRTLLVALVLLATLAAWSPLRSAEADRISELLALRAGMHVADVGAGDGEWSMLLAREVGVSGHVYVTEIDEEELDKIRARLEESDLRNLSVIVGRPDDTMLPDSCCDAILLRLVVHHMDDPEAMVASLRRSIRSGGLLLVIEKHERYGHGITPEDLTRRMSGGGFRVLSEHPDWGDEGELYGILFRAAGESPPVRER